MELIFCPFLTREKFCDQAGISPDVLSRWIRDGRVVTFKMGKRSLIDMRQWLSNKNEEKKA